MGAPRRAGGRHDPGPATVRSDDKARRTFCVQLSEGAVSRPAPAYRVGPLASRPQAPPQFMTLVRYQVHAADLAESLADVRRGHAVDHEALLAPGLACDVIDGEQTLEPALFVDDR